jgi:transcriptional regulator with XRE-family HTH domain
VTNLLPEQCRAARAFLDWSQRELAIHSQVSQKTIADFERKRKDPQVRTLNDLREAFERAGIEFTYSVEGDHGHGLNMRNGFSPVTRP